MTKEIIYNMLISGIKGFFEGLWSLLVALPWWVKILVIVLVLFPIFFNRYKGKRY